MRGEVVHEEIGYTDVVTFRVEVRTASGRRFSRALVVDPLTLDRAPILYGLTLDRLVADIERHIAAEGARIQ